tara:strand:- start:380 stop:610 length:231 start_codon:yes stop_codon:yes gene_type:complete
MITNLIILNNPGIFVWLSFGVSLISCAVVYVRTKKTLRKYENEFAAELEKLSVVEKNAIIERSKIASQLVAKSKIF